MKIKDALVIAADQFIQRFDDGDKTLQVLEQYGTEELKLAADIAKTFAAEATAGQTTEWLNTEEEKNRFFVWYYINHVAQVT